jgi:hypothetical protein
VVTIAEITPVKMVLELSWAEDTFMGERETSVKGKHAFVFKK